MKIILTMLALSILSGCAINHTKWADAEELCESFGGVKSVLVHQNITECKDGVYVQRVK